MFIQSLRAFRRAIFFFTNGLLVRGFVFVGLHVLLYGIFVKKTSSTIMLTRHRNSETSHRRAITNVPKSTQNGAKMGTKSRTIWPRGLFGARSRQGRLQEGFRSSGSWPFSAFVAESVAPRDHCSCRATADTLRSWLLKRTIWKQEPGRNWRD